MKTLAALLLALLLCPALAAQMKHDPLTAREVDLLRDSAQEPRKRIDLLLNFTYDRVLAVDRLRATAKPSERDAASVASLLGDIAVLIDELDDNLEMYNRHSEDLRRPLRHVIDAEEGYLKTLQSLEAEGTSLERRRFATALADATESISASLEAARKMLADQVAKKGEDKRSPREEREERRRNAEDPEQGPPPSPK